MTADHKARGGVSEAEYLAVVRGILRSRADLFATDEQWPKELKLHRSRAKKFGDLYLSSRSLITDAFRDARVALEAAAQVRATQDHGGEANEMIREVERLRALLAQPERQPMGFHERHAALYARAAAAEARAAKAVEVLRECRLYVAHHAGAISWGGSVDLLKQVDALLSDHPAPEPSVEANIRECLLRLKNECEIDGLDAKAGFDAWLSWANKLLGTTPRRALQTPANGGRDGK